MALLLGPPEIANLPPAPAPLPIIQMSSVDQAKLYDYVSLVRPHPTGTDGDNQQDDPDSMDLTPMGLTENLAPTFLSTGNPCLDFFFHVVPDTPSNDLIKRLEEAWSHNQLTTLKLIFNLRGVRGTGKSDKNGFYTAAIWLHQNHPKTLARSVRAIADFGYFKDLLEILYRILNGSGVREIEKKKRSKPTVFINWNSEESEDRDVIVEKKQKVLKTLEQVREEKEQARILRKERKINKARNALEMYNGDEDYRFLHNQISDLFADLLKSDMKNLESGNLDKISLAPKWCPTIDSSYDKSTLICESIARKLFPRSSDPSYENLEEAHYAYRIRERLRKEVLSPLHKAVELPEVFMSANQWNSLPYNRVPSVAMKNYKRHFIRHDKERFDDYLEKVRTGKAKIAAGALLPHEIVKAVVEKNLDGDGDAVAELQWKRMVDDMAKKGKLSNCIAVCDVSASMSGIPMDVSVALGVLLSELSEEPWKGKVITFSEHPQIHTIEGDSLAKKIGFVQTMDWGQNTNFQAVFDRLLEVAIEGKVSEEQMIKRVFVFSDMEFDAATEECFDYTTMSSIPSDGKEWETNYEAIERKFREKGYMKVPEMVFWNLRSSRSTPVTGKQKGVALVSGYSKNLMSMFLEEGGDLNPEDVMELAIAGKEYEELAVFD